jgi:hypothetical protein
MCIPPLTDLNTNHRCGGLRVWLGLDTNQTGQLVDSLSGPNSASSVLASCYKDADLCFPECTAAPSDSSDDEEYMVSLIFNILSTHL